MTTALQLAAPTVVPEQWRDAFSVLGAGFSWLLDWERLVLSLLASGNAMQLTLKGVLLLLPVALLIAALWCTVASLYTLPFRSGRAAFLTAMLMSWWDAGRMTWFYWAGLLRFAIVVVGWVWSLLKLAVSLLGRMIAFVFTRPLTFLDWATRQYFQPGVPWLAFLLILLWSALEATIFTFTLRPTISEVLADLTSTELASWAVTLVLWPFLFILISGSFAAIQALVEAVRSRQVPQIVGMLFVEAFVMFFEVMFLYRELIDAITPWIAEQTGRQLGFVSTLALASFGWVGVRAMTWFLFGRFGTPALLGVLARENIAGARGPATAAPIGPDLWRGPIAALKTDAVWFKREAREAFELMSLPVLQLLAAALNFAVVLILGRPTFVLPFRDLEQVMASTPIGAPTGKQVVGGAA